MEKLVVAAVPEPQWILHRTETGQPLFWRRDGSGDNPRVKFKYDVEIKEFSRPAHELEDPVWAKDVQVMTSVSLCITCLFCIAVVMLPWYIMIK